MIKHEYLFLKDRLTGLKRVKIDAGVNGNNTIVAAVTGKIIRVYQVILMSDAALTVRFQSGAGGTDLTGNMPLAANVGFSSGWCPVGHFETTEGVLLNLFTSAIGNVDGWLVYGEV